MRVTVRLRGPIAARIESPNYVIEIEENSTIGEVLQLLLHNHDEIRELWNSPELIDRDALILLNEVDTALTGGLQSKIVEGDQVVILPLVHGG
ncbi:MAG: MoaD/ThiS family protein [Promethearchaeota archaeon]